MRIHVLALKKFMMLLHTVSSQQFSIIWYYRPAKKIKNSSWVAIFTKQEMIFLPLSATPKTPPTYWKRRFSTICDYCGAIHNRLRSFMRKNFHSLPWHHRVVKRGAELSPHLRRRILVEKMMITKIYPLKMSARIRTFWIW